MDFSSREVKPQAPQSAPVSTPTATASSVRGRGGKSDNKWGRIGVVAAVAAVVLLLIALTVLAATGGGKKESEYVDSTKLQAVFLNTGQVYFGNVKSMNSKFFVLSNIYYLQTSGNGEAANTNANVSLVKLGCELHEPFDQMVINRDQVTFWENLQDNGQVATAVATFKKQNPDGQKCADQSTSADTNSSNNAQNATPNTGNNATTNTNNANNNANNP